MIIKATVEDTKLVQDIVYKTISEIYPNYYPQEVVDFFLNHHSQDRIVHDIEQDNVYLLRHDSCGYIGTGTIADNAINRVFVLPQYQSRGYGSQIMDFLESLISENYNRISLDSSLPAFALYLKRGYKPTEYHQENAANNRVLCYQMMVKEVQSGDQSGFNLNNRLFGSISNTDNGEVSDQTFFRYHQQGNSIWASYEGGDIERGTLVGKYTDCNQIYFTYQHLNMDGDIRIGECRSLLEKLDDGRIIMHESWQWLNGDLSEGSSVIEEINENYNK